MLSYLFWLIKFALYFTFGYIPLLIVCLIVSTCITAVIVQLIDYCYGSMECFLHGAIITVIGPVVGFEISVVLAIAYIWHKFHQSNQKPKRKPTIE